MFDNKGSSILTIFIIPQKPLNKRFLKKTGKLEA